MTFEDLLEAIERELGWRINAESVEFLQFNGEGRNSKVQVKSARPATQQEKALWRLMMTVARRIAAGEDNVTLTFVNAHEVKDSFGTPKDV